MEKTANGRGTLFYGILILLECLVWGVSNALIKIWLTGLGPLWCLSIRYFIASILFFAVFYRRIREKFRKSDVKPCVIIGSCTALAFISGFVSVTLTSATTAGFLMSLAVVIAPFLAWALLRTRVRLLNLVPIIIVSIGMLLICGGLSEGMRFGPGELLAIVSSCGTALMLVFSGKYLTDTDPFVLCVIQCATCFIICTAVAFVLEPAPVFASITAYEWGYIAFIVLLCTFLAYICQNIALKHLSPMLVALGFCAEPLFTALAAFIILGERLNTTGFIGAVLIMISIVMASVISELENRKAISEAQPPQAS